MATAVRPVEERRLAAIGLFIGAYFLFTVVDSCAKWLGQHSHLPTSEGHTHAPASTSGMRQTVATNAA